MFRLHSLHDKCEWKKRLLCSVLKLCNNRVTIQTSSASYLALKIHLCAGRSCPSTRMTTSLHVADCSNCRPWPSSCCLFVISNFKASSWCLPSASTFIILWMALCQFASSRAISVSKFREHGAQVIPELLHARHASLERVLSSMLGKWIYFATRFLSVSIKIRRR